MSYGKAYRDTCIVCGAPRPEGQRLSDRGKCPSCGDGHMLANANQLRSHAGPWFHHWRNAVARAVGASLDDGPPSEHTG